MKTSSSSVESVQSMYGAFGRGDIPAILAQLHPSVEWRLNVDPAAPGVARIATFRVFRGPGQVGEFFAGLARDLEFHSFQPTEFFAAEHSVAARVQMEWTVRATRRCSRMESMHVFTFAASGQVTHFREFTDTLGVAAAWEVVQAKG